eukprot:6526608-Pyramimonas_sp.AAC.1
MAADARAAAAHGTGDLHRGALDGGVADAPALGCRSGAPATAYATPTSPGELPGPIQQSPGG